jgi:hypothetical protein
MHMAEQNYANHRRYFIPFHYVLLPLVILTWLATIVHAYRVWVGSGGFGTAVLLFLLASCLLMLCPISRMSALKAQDRAIRAEENLRHYLLAGKLLDPKLTIRQIIGLRFASDEEFLALAARAAAESLSEDDVKKAVKNWKPDTYRV